MTKLVRMYIRNVLIGLGLSLVFVGLLLALNVANLWHLVTHSPGGVIAVIMLVVFNTIVFAGVQFSIAVMRMARRDDSGGGGLRARLTPALAAPVTVTENPRGAHNHKE